MRYRSLRPSEFLVLVAEFVRNNSGKEIWGESEGIKTWFHDFMTVSYCEIKKLATEPQASSDSVSEIHPRQASAPL